MDNYWEKLKNETEYIEHLFEYINSKKNFIISKEDVESIYYTFKTQKLLIFNSKPGMGKTELCNGIVDAFKDLYKPDTVVKIFVPVEKDYEKTDLLGYQGLDEKYYPSKFARELFNLDNDGNPQERKEFIIVFVILDEMNLGQIDGYFSKVLSAIENNEKIELPNKVMVSLPENAFFFGTINSYTTESSRNPISSSVKRRANIINLKNPLYERMDEIEESERLKKFREILSTVCDQSKAHYEKTHDFLNAYRIANFEDIEAKIKKEDFYKPLYDLVVAFSDYEESKMTIGILQDIIEYMIFSSFDYNKSIDIQIVQKILPQLSGSIENYSQLEMLIDKYELSQSKNLYMKMKSEAEQNLGQIVTLC